MNARKFFALVALVGVAALVLALAGCGSAAPSSSSTAPAAKTTQPSSSTAPAQGNSGENAGHKIIVISSKGFTPSKLEVKAGSQVVWQNNTSQPHSIAFDDGSLTSPDIKGMGVAGHTFAEPGTYPYHDGHDSSLKGTVVVVK